MLDIFESDSGPANSISAEKSRFLGFVLLQRTEPEKNQNIVTSSWISDSSSRILTLSDFFWNFILPASFLIPAPKFRTDV